MFQSTGGNCQKKGGRVGRGGNENDVGNEDTEPPMIEKENF